MNIIRKNASCMEEYVKIVGDFVSERKGKNMIFYSRGESEDFGETSLYPSIYRDGLLKNEHKLYRELIRFNEKDFEHDKTTIDCLCRMQHSICPTRMLDLSEDCFTSLYFALEYKKPDKEAFIYIFPIPTDKVRYYDSDTATVLANLVKLPLQKDGSRNLYGDKSKTHLVQIAKDIIEKGMDTEEYNKKLNFLLHEIREDKPYMQPYINLGDIFSVQCVKTRLNNDRILRQKGAFLLFGLNIKDVEKPISLYEDYDKPNYWRDEYEWQGMPIKEMLKIRIENTMSLENIENLGISKPSIYPDMEKVGEYFKKKYGG